jgi:methionine biosynthesis protein MetW
MRADLDIIKGWIPKGSRVLDLGCGDGELLSWLAENRNVSGYGLEIDPDKIERCLSRGVSVIEQNLDDGLGNFGANSFDVVVMTQSLQALHFPDKVLSEMLRVGKHCIITFPNFGHWRCRLYLGARGRMPVSDFLPYTWYNTPNIHFCTFEDFERLCVGLGARVMDRLAVDRNHRHGPASKVWPNLFGEIGIYRITGAELSEHRGAV